MQIIPRTTWRNDYRLGWNPRPLPAKTAWLHHDVSGTPPTNDTHRETLRMRLLDRIGYQRFGPPAAAWGPQSWRGAGVSYSYVVMPSGRAYQGHRIDLTSSHTSGHNTDGIGICWPGNYEAGDRPTAAQIEQTAQLLVHLKKIGVLINARLSGGHRDVYPTSCPGRHAYAVIGQINSRAAQIESGAPPPPPPPDHTAEIKRVQTLINVIGVADPDLDVDGSAGPLTQSAIKAYADNFDYSGSHTAWLALIDSMEATVSLLKTIAADVKAGRDAAETTVRQTDPTYRPGDNVETEPGSRAHRYRWITRDGRQLYAAEGGHLAAIMLPQILDKLGGQPQEVAGHLLPVIEQAIRDAVSDADAEAIIDALVRRLATTEAEADA